MKEETEEMDVDEEDAGPQFFIIQKDQLMQLLQRCFKCGSKISAKVRLYTSVTNLSAKFFCPTCKIVKKWSGQQMVENTEQSLGTLRLIAAANVAPVAYPELSTLLDVAGIAGLSSTTFQGTPLL
uniref:Uncharacterized protein n=1 Tax=Ditylenchus dipsaci TaxID=166011 RepID=A0A915D8T8_9BILA